MRRCDRPQRLHPTSPLGALEASRRGYLRLAVQCLPVHPAHSMPYAHYCCMSTGVDKMVVCSAHWLTSPRMSTFGFGPLDPMSTGLCMRLNANVLAHVHGRRIHRGTDLPETNPRELGRPWAIAASTIEATDSTDSPSVQALSSKLGVTDELTDKKSVDQIGNVR